MSETTFTLIRFSEMEPSASGIQRDADPRNYGGLDAMNLRAIRATSITLACCAFSVSLTFANGGASVVLPNGDKALVPQPVSDDGYAALQNAGLIYRKALSACDGNCCTGVLWSVAEYLAFIEPVKTNAFIQEALEAIKKDDALIHAGKITPPPVLMGRLRTPNVMAVSNRHRQIRKWNIAVEECRRDLLTIASRSLKDCAKTLGEKADAFRSEFISRARLTPDETCFFLRELSRKSDTGFSH